MLLGLKLALDWGGDGDAVRSRLIEESVMFVEAIVIFVRFCKFCKNYGTDNPFRRVTYQSTFDWVPIGYDPYPHKIYAQRNALYICECYSVD